MYEIKDFLFYPEFNLNIEHNVLFRYQWSYESYRMIPWVSVWWLSSWSSYELCEYIVVVQYEYDVRY